MTRTKLTQFYVMANTAVGSVPIRRNPIRQILKKYIV